MDKLVYINLPVENLERSKKFYSQLGYEFNQLYTNDVAACMVVSKTIHVMLLTKPFFSTFTQKTIVDAKSNVQVLICLSIESREAVDALVGKALELGATAERPPNDHSFMYERSFSDLDGHIWEIMWMDEAAYKKAIIS